MRFHSAAFVVVVIATLAGAWGPPARADDPPPLKLFAVEFVTGPGWDHAKPPNEQKHFAEHSKNLRRLRDEGRLPMGARYGDKGLVIVAAPSLEAVQAEFAGDPAVRDSVFLHDIREFSVFYPGMVERPAPRKETGPPPPSVALPAELARVLTDYEKAWGAKDYPALAGLFAEDGFVLSSGMAPVRGRAAIEKHYTGMVGPLFLRAYAFEVDGDSGYILGGYTGKAGAPDEGKFTLTLTRSGGGPWLIMSDMDNRNSR